MMLILCRPGMLHGVKTTGSRQRSSGKPGGFGKIESWVFDSGAGPELMSRCLANKKSVKKAEETLTFWTANGRTNTAQVCEEKLSVLNEKVKAYLLKDTPAILSLGVRCMQLGYGSIGSRMSFPTSFVLRTEDMSSCSWTTLCHACRRGWMEQP